MKTKINTPACVQKISTLEFEDVSFSSEGVTKNYQATGSGRFFLPGQRGHDFFAPSAQRGHDFFGPSA